MKMKYLKLNVIKFLTKQKWYQNLIMNYKKINNAIFLHLLIIPFNDSKAKKSYILIILNHQ
jgi:hypothetical protein